WEDVKQSLERARELTAAVGLAGPGPALLRIPAPPAFDAAQASDRLKALQESFPRYAEWNAVELPAGFRSDSRVALEASYRHLIEAGQQLILRQLNRLSADAQETP